ncbi:Nucleoside diphosphate-linked moiety X motif 19, mitochondrial [Phlyctochytrium bullatum]|nr:Nucleoside diphosphate-linked moiety X motif 19, mitochondrial [Phlyctochytrium bullatum]
MAALRPASTLILCDPLPTAERVPGKPDFRVLMMKRNQRGLFGSLHVFPGGALDPVDHDAEWGKILPSSHDAVQRSNIASLRPYALAAVRETFEETGIALLDPLPSWTPAEHDTWREKVHNHGPSFLALCQHYRTLPALPRLIHWAHWITPAVEKKRFETQFFLALMPEGHPAASADGKEGLALEWLTPDEALHAFERGDIMLFPPQFLTLTTLTNHTVASLTAHFPAAGRAAVPPPVVDTYLPEPVTRDAAGRVAMALPGDEMHSTAAARGLQEGCGARHRVWLGYGAGKGDGSVVKGIRRMEIERVEAGGGGAKM